MLSTTIQRFVAALSYLFVGITSALGVAVLVELLNPAFGEATTAQMVTGAEVRHIAKWKSCWRTASMSTILPDFLLSFTGAERGGDVELTPAERTLHSRSAAVMVVSQGWPLTWGYYYFDLATPAPVGGGYSWGKLREFKFGEQHGLMLDDFPKVVCVVPSSYSALLVDGVLFAVFAYGLVTACHRVYWLFVRQIRKKSGRCTECGYWVGPTTPRCSECGSKLLERNESGRV